LALAPALQVLTWPFLALTLIILGRGWYLELTSARRLPTAWGRRSTLVLAASTLLAGTIWGLRFAGFLGGMPI